MDIHDLLPETEDKMEHKCQCHEVSQKFYQTFVREARTLLS